MRRLETSAAVFLPERRTLPALRAAAADCRGCELYKRASQTVFGSGSSRAHLMLIGEIPGDEEDRQGKPFVGPAGRLLQDALSEAGIATADTYITNAVKHFHWEPRGKRRLHKKPSARHIQACKPWLQAEILVVEPSVIVCLGAVASQSLLGSGFRLTRHRGELLASPWAPWLVATYHPSAILRAPDAADRQLKREQFVSDLRMAAAKLPSSGR